MILADTSIWIDHFRSGDAALAKALDDGQIVMHPFILGELACGNLTNRMEILTLLDALPKAPVASNDEVLSFIEQRRLFGKVIGLVDVHLLASAALMDTPSLWTRDKRLASVAQDLGIAFGGSPG